MNLFNKIFTYKSIGSRQIQEDNFYTFDFEDIERETFNSFFIFDGHGAKEVSDSLPDFLIHKNIFIQELKKYFSTRKVSCNTITAFFSYFDMFLESIVKKHVGTCLSGVLVSPSSIYTITLGDTVIKIFNTSNKLYFQTPLHNFKNELELERYKKNKQDHFIKQNRYKGLLISRTLGDYDCKILGERCLIPVPEVKCIHNNRSFIFLLKTDGMTVSSKTLVTKYNDQTLMQYLEKKNFADNACVVIFSTTNEKNCIKTGQTENERKNIEESKANVVLLKFLQYVYE